MVRLYGQHKMKNVRDISVDAKMKLDNDTFENTVKSRFFRMTDKQVLY